MNKVGKLELTWVGKYSRKQYEPRILIEQKEKSYGSSDTENKLIHGDNLLALRALENEYQGKIKCIYIDPPYNINAANGHYDDALENSEWLSLMHERLQLLKNLMSDDGVIFVQIDKEQSAYLKVLMDEVFGRSNFVTTIAVRMSATSGFKIEHSDKTIVKNVEYIHVYSKKLTLQPIYEEAEYDTHYSSILTEIEPEIYIMESLLKQESVKELFAKFKLSCSNNNLPTLYKICEDFRRYVYENRFRIGRTHTAPAATKTDEEFLQKILVEDNYVVKRVYNGEEYYIKRTSNGYNQYIPISLKFNMVDSTNDYSLKLSNILGDWWDGFYLDMGNVDNEGDVYFKNSKKPERLLFRIINNFSNEGEWVLDSFLGSGTTAAVAHKLKRKYIGIEMGEHCNSLCLPRLKNVVDGEQGGVSRFVDWKGGGGFKFYELAEPLLVKNPVLPVYQINPSYTWEMVCEAICKIEGFTYAPAGEFQGYSSENRFIHITEEFVNTKYIMSVMKTLGERQSLLIYCKKNQADMMLPENVEVKKIPKDLLQKCTFESEV